MKAKDPRLATEALEALLVLQGRLREAERVSEPRLAKATAKERIGRRLGLAVAARDPLRAQNAVKEAEAANLLADPSMGSQAVAVLGITGDQAGAAALAPRVLAAPGWDKLPPVVRRFLEGIMAFASGKPEQAEPALREVAASPMSSLAYQATCILGEFLLHENRPAEAVDVLRKASTFPGGTEDWGYSWMHPRILGSLAAAHERLGQRDAAKARVGELLALWKDADAELPLLAQARALRRKLDGQKVVSEARP